MSKRRFIRELRVSLSHLPKSEVDKAISYYSECIEDMLDDGMTEEEAVFSLDSMENIVTTIEEISADNGVEVDYKKKITPVDSEVVDDDKKSDGQRASNVNSDSNDNRKNNTNNSNQNHQYINGKRVDGGSLGRDISSSVKIAVSSKMRAAANKITSIATNMDNKQKSKKYNPYASDSKDNYNEGKESVSKNAKKDASQADNYSSYSENDNKTMRREYADYEYEPSVYDKSKDKVRDVVTKKRSTTTNVILGLTSIIWAPILLALIVAGSAVVFGLFIAAIAISISIVAIIVSLGVGGLILIIQGVFVACSGLVHSGIASIGVGVAVIGLTLLIAKPMFFVSGKIFYGLLGLVKAGYNSIFRRRARV